MPKFEIKSALRCESSVVSNGLLCMRGVNYELYPFIRMSFPAEKLDERLSDWPAGVQLFTSKILLLGFIPIDSHLFKFDKIFNNGFEESSSSLLNKRWNHRRTIVPHKFGSTVHDEVDYISKLAILDWLTKPIYRLIFVYRHKRLKSKYGVAT